MLGTVRDNPAKTAATARSLPGRHWTLVLRRKPVRLVAGRPEGGYTDVYELVCADCGDDPDLDYREVSPGRRRIRGPYLIAAGVAAYEKHVRLYHGRAATLEPINDSPSDPRRSPCERRRAQNEGPRRGRRYSAGRPLRLEAVRGPARPGRAAGGAEPDP